MKASYTKDYPDQFKSYHPLLHFFRLNLDVKVRRTTRDVNLPDPLSKPHSKKHDWLIVKSETL